MTRRVVLSGALAALALHGAVEAAEVGGTGIREVTASAHSVIPIQARLRYTTLILLPEGQEIMDAACGDKDFWVVSVSKNLAHIKPAKEGAATNLNLVTTTGAVYSFLLTEKGGTSAPDLKVYVTPDADNGQPIPMYFSAREMAAVRDQLAVMTSRVETLTRDAATAKTTAEQQYPLTLHFPFGTLRYAKPFLVRAIWHDGRCTYIKTDAPELPALYETSDGTPALVTFEVKGDTYVVPKVLHTGYLALGKARYPFAQQER